MMDRDRLVGTAGSKTLKIAKIYDNLCPEKLLKKWDGTHALKIMGLKS